ncbi:hypothetical protein OTU49_015352 [Cherax quadricarinatus]|uniref:glucose-6-phosphatase n=1 Tax=Cherax quadricarinatus TaxID=27406 RepID=A0AAW0YC46_CHEQU
MFKGDRPYWWIGETSLYNDETRPELRQFTNTCESGPGTPSGHLMLNVALFYVATKGISKLFIQKSTKLSLCQKSILSAVVYTGFLLWIGVIFISRLYIQAHFIHQNILGVIIGLGLSSDQRYVVLNAPRNFIRTILTIKGGILIGKMAAMIQANLPTDDMVLFLALSFGLNIALPFIIIALLPHFLLTVYYGN